MPSKHGAALSSWEAGGPLHPGHASDKHLVASNGDGEPVNSLHLSVDHALWYRDQKHDAPLEFSRVPYGPQRAPIRVRAWIRYHERNTHSWLEETRPGLWRLEAESFFAQKDTSEIVPDTPGDGTPEEDAPVPNDTTPSTEEPQKQPQDPDPPPAPPGDVTHTPDEPTGDPTPQPGGDASGDDPGGATTPESPPTSPPDSGPPGSIGNPLPGLPVPGGPPTGGGSQDGGTTGGGGGDGLPGVPGPPPTFGGGYPGPSFVRPIRIHRRIQQEYDQPQAVAWSPHQIGTAALLAFPEPVGRAGATDLRYESRIVQREAIREASTRPAVARIDSWGREDGAGGWAYHERPGWGSVPGGTAAGGFVVLPPQIDVLDVDDPPVGTTTAYFAVGPGAALGFGAPDRTTGDLADDSLRVVHETTTLVVERRSGGTWSEAAVFGTSFGLFGTSATQAGAISYTPVPTIDAGSDTIDLADLNAKFSDLSLQFDGVLGVLRGYGLIAT